MSTNLIELAMAWDAAEPLLFSHVHTYTSTCAAQDGTPGAHCAQHLDLVAIKAPKYSELLGNDRLFYIVHNLTHMA